MEHTKNRIIEHASELFAKKGCKALTMDDIASALGMSKRTIYEHFSDKNTLIDACVSYFFESQSLRIERVLKSSDNIIESMYQQMESNSKIMTQVKFDFFGEIRKYYPKVYENTVKTFKQKMLRYTTEVLQKGQKEGVIRSDINARVAAIIMHETVSMIYLTNVFDVYDVPKMELLIVVYLVSRGAATTKGIKLIDKYVENYQENTKND